MRKVLSIAAAFAACAPVGAEEAPEQLSPITVEARDEQPGLRLESRSGTASRLGLTLRETPQSLTVFTRQRIEDFNLITIAIISLVHVDRLIRGWHAVCVCAAPFGLRLHFLFQ